MKLSKRDWLTIIGFLFIVAASTIPVFDASKISGYGSHVNTTLFDWIKLNLLSLKDAAPSLFI